MNTELNISELIIARIARRARLTTNAASLMRIVAFGTFRRLQSVYTASSDHGESSGGVVYPDDAEELIAAELVTAGPHNDRDGSELIPTAAGTAFARRIVLHETNVRRNNMAPCDFEKWIVSTTGS